MPHSRGDTLRSPALPAAGRGYCRGVCPSLSPKSGQVTSLQVTRVSQGRQQRAGPSHPPLPCSTGSVRRTPGFHRQQSLGQKGKHRAVTCHLSPSSTNQNELLLCRPVDHAVETAAAVTSTAGHGLAVRLKVSVPSHAPLDVFMTHKLPCGFIFILNGIKLESLSGQKVAASEHKDRGHFCLARLHVPGTWPSARHRGHIGRALKEAGKQGGRHMGGARAVIVTVRGDVLKPALRALRGGSPGRKRPFTPKTAAPCRPNIKQIRLRKSSL